MYLVSMFIYVLGEFLLVGHSFVQRPQAVRVLLWSEAVGAPALVPAVSEGRIWHFQHFQFSIENSLIQQHVLQAPTLYLNIQTPDCCVVRLVYAEHAIAVVEPVPILSVYGPLSWLYILSIDIFRVVLLKDNWIEHSLSLNGVPAAATHEGVLYGDIHITDECKVIIFEGRYPVMQGSAS